MDEVCRCGLPRVECAVPDVVLFACGSWYITWGVGSKHETRTEMCYRLEVKALEDRIEELLGSGIGS